MGRNPVYRYIYSINRLQRQRLFRACCNACSTAGTEVIVDRWLGDLSECGPEANRALVADVTTGLADDLAASQASITDTQLQLPGRLVVSAQGRGVACIDAFTTKCACAAIKIDFGVAARATHNNLLFAGLDAVIAGCAGFGKTTFSNGPGGA